MHFPASDPAEDWYFAELNESGDRRLYEHFANAHSAVFVGYPDGI
jgi:hypothetical protein